MRLMKVGLDGFFFPLVTLLLPQGLDSLGTHGLHAKQNCMRAKLTGCKLFSRTTLDLHC